MRIVLPIAAAALLCPTLAAAQPTPKFEYGKADDLKDVKEVEWTATTEASVVLTRGNSSTTTLAATAKATRKEKKNKLSIEATGTYARAESVVGAADLNGNAAISENEIIRASKTSAESWQSKLRYDRFLSEWDSLYIAALAGADQIAGKDFVGGGQLGYARLAYKTEKHEVSVEGGYDFSYENYVDPTAKSLAIHSARGFAGYKGKLTDDTSLDGSVEVLVNVNGQSDEVGPGEDVRATAIGSLSTKLTASVSFAFSVTAKFDNVPAPFSIPDAAGMMLPADLANPPESDKLDTTTKASLIINFF